MISLGDAHAPRWSRKLSMSCANRQPASSSTCSALSLADRPAFASKLLIALAEIRTRFGRPHWIVIDEAHHMTPAQPWPTASFPARLHNAILITAQPASLARAALEATSAIVAVGPEAPSVIASYCSALKLPAPRTEPPGDNEVVYWDRSGNGPPAIVTVDGPSSEHRRHIRKYSKGTLGEDKSFYFRGPKGALNLRAHNLTVFLQIADGVDEETWLFHLKRHDYSRWVRNAIKDEELANEIERVETGGLEPSRSRAEVQRMIGARYTAPEEA